MALITCLDCHQEISDAALACIHCGRPNHPPIPTPAASDPDGTGPVRLERAISRVERLHGTAVWAVIVIGALTFTVEERSEGLSRLLEGLGLTAVGVILLGRFGIESAAPGNGGVWGGRFASKDQKQDFWVGLVLGGIAIVLGIVHLGRAALEAAG